LRFRNRSAEIPAKAVPKSRKVDGSGVSSKVSSKEVIKVAAAFPAPFPPFSAKLFRIPMVVWGVVNWIL
jgi:hypothetical protein